MCWLYFKRKVLVLYILFWGLGGQDPTYSLSPFTAGRHCVYGLSADYLKHTVLSISRRCFMWGGGEGRIPYRFPSKRTTRVYSICVYEKSTRHDRVKCQLDAIIIIRANVSCRGPLRLKVRETVPRDIYKNEPRNYNDGISPISDTA